MTFVNQSLSRGLADRFLDEVQQRKEFYGKRRQELLGSALPHKRTDVAQIAKRLLAAGEECSFTQVFAAHPKWRWAAIATFAPWVEPIAALGEFR